jgi:hypothetical protein
VKADATAIEGLVPVIVDRPTVDVEYFVDPGTNSKLTTFHVTWQGAATAFRYSGTPVSIFGPMQGQADGSVMIALTIDGQQFVDRLTPDGQVRRMAIPPDGAQYGAAWVDGDGFYRLETSGDPWQWNLVRYALP